MSPHYSVQRILVHVIIVFVKERSPFSKRKYTVAVVKKIVNEKDSESNLRPRNLQGFTEIYQP